MESWLCKQRRKDRLKKKNEVEIQKARRLLPKEWEICRKQGWDEMESYLRDSLHLHLCLITQSCLTLWNAMDCSPPGSSVHGGSPGKHTGVGCHALLQGIFPTLGLNPGLLHCRQICYRLSHQGSPAHIHVLMQIHIRRNIHPCLLVCEHRFSIYSSFGNSDHVNVALPLLTSSVWEGKE